MSTFNQTYANLIKETLDHFEIHFEFKDGVFYFAEGSKRKSDTTFWNIVTNERSIDAYAVSPINAESECFQQTVEFITRASYGLPDGNFEFDYSDGEVRFHVHRELGFISEADVRKTLIDAFLIAKFTYSRYNQALLKLMLFNQPGANIEAIVNQCESEPSNLEQMLSELCNNSENDNDE